MEKETFGSFESGKEIRDFWKNTTVSPKGDERTTKSCEWSGFFEKEQDSYPSRRVDPTLRPVGNNDREETLLFRKGRVVNLRETYERSESRRVGKAGLEARPRRGAPRLGPNGLATQLALRDLRPRPHSARRSRARRVLLESETLLSITKRSIRNYALSKCKDLFPHF